MKNYVFVSHDTGSNNAHYLGYMGEKYVYYSDVNKALRFDIDEVAEIIKENSSLISLGFSVIYIADCTFDILKTDKELQKKYTDFLFVAR